MVEIRVDGGELHRAARPGWTGHLRRPVVLLTVMLLCGAAYLGGIWYGTRGGFTCTTAQPGVIQCGSDAGTPLPVEPPAAPLPGTGSA